jgi:hypothetical protein
LFENCAGTFSKLCNVTEACKGAPSSTPPYLTGPRPRVSVGNKTCKLHHKDIRNYIRNLSGRSLGRHRRRRLLSGSPIRLSTRLLGVCGGEHHSEICSGGFLP